MPIAFFTRTRTGALVSRLNNDVIGAQRAFSDTLSGVVGNIVTLSLTLVVMLALSWQITLLALRAAAGLRAAGPADGSAAGPAGARGRQPQRGDEHPDDRAVLRARRDAGQAVRPARPRSRASSSPAPRRVRDIGVRTAMVQWVFVTALTLVSALALALVYGLGGLLRAAAARWTAGRRRLPGPAAHPAVRAADRAGQRPGRGDERAGQLRAGLRGARPAAADHASRERPDAAARTGRCRSSFDDVRFAYPSADKVSLASLEEVAVLDTRGGVEVLHDVSFRAEPGQMVALVGSSGAGKSTIAQLVPRLYDVDAGAVRLGGVDVRDLSLRRDPRRARHGHPGRAPVPRVGAGEPAARPRRRRPRTSCGTRCAGPGWTTLVASLPDGLDTVVGERGYRLSGGERQRLTIARLLLARPRVVILDEATAHLDSTSEAAVQAALAEALAGRTAVVIAHRLSTIRAADLILVVEDGRIVERGTHAGAAGARRPLRRAVPHPVRDPGDLTAEFETSLDWSDLTVLGELVLQVGDRCGHLVQRQADDEAGLSRSALHRDGAVVGLDDGRDDGQAESRAGAPGRAGGAHPAGVGPGEALEHPIQRSPARCRARCRSR